MSVHNFKHYLKVIFSASSRGACFWDTLIILSLWQISFEYILQLFLNIQKTIKSTRNFKNNLISIVFIFYSIFVFERISSTIVIFQYARHIISFIIFLKNHLKVHMYVINLFLLWRGMIRHKARRLGALLSLAAVSLRLPSKLLLTPKPRNIRRPSRSTQTAPPFMVVIYWIT